MHIVSFVATKKTTFIQSFYYTWLTKPIKLIKSTLRIENGTENIKKSSRQITPKNATSLSLEEITEKQSLAKLN